MKAIVTGAANGIGRATVLRLAQAKTASFVLVDMAAEPLERLAAELRQNGHQVDTLVGDVSDRTVPEKAVDLARAAMAGVDVIVSNAGTFSSGPLKDTSVEDFDYLFAVNTRTTWLLGKAAHPMLKASRGCIVATASIAGIDPQPPYGSYSASKAALIRLVRQMANEWGPDGIRCNCVSPGPTVTGRTAAFYQNKVATADREAKIPLRRIGASEDIANAIAFLASPEAAYISGANLIVDGALGTTMLPGFASYTV